MKNVFKVCALTAMIGFAGAAMADEAKQTFVWTGTVTPASVGGSTTIVNKGTVDFDSGMLAFAEAALAGTYDVISSNEISFGISEADPMAKDHQWELETFEFAHGGSFMQAVDTTTPEFTLSANGASVVPGSKVSITPEVDKVTLKIQNDNPIDFVKPGESVVVQATILVTHSV